MPKKLFKQFIQETMETVYAKVEAAKEIKTKLLKRGIKAVSIVTLNSWGNVQ
jgi:hypothetical protein